MIGATTIVMEGLVSIIASIASESGPDGCSMPKES